MTLAAPFPWFGGKSCVADLVWERLGADVPNYVEPFFGSGAVMLGRPNAAIGIETINDKDGFVSNFWRAVAADPEAVAAFADWPVNENDLHARHAWLVARRETLVAELEGDPNFYDAQIAGWWCWGLCLWIGSGWCSGRGPWSVEDGRLIVGTKGQGINRQLPHLGNKGQGINRQLPHLGDKGKGDLSDQISESTPILSWFCSLSDRLRRVRVCCGDWSRVMGPSPTTKIGMTGVFLDPPYGDENDRCEDLYMEDSQSLARDVLAWCREHGADPMMRIALCGYDGEHNELEALGWSVMAWKAHGGYGLQGNTTGRENSPRERIWFSPHCIDARQGKLF
jgi:DNA adenine methylase